MRAVQGFRQRNFVFVPSNLYRFLMLPLHRGNSPLCLSSKVRNASTLVFLEVATWKRSVCDAFLAATADYLSRVNGILSPECALDQDLALTEPWFSEEFSAVRLRLLRDTPSAFKDKNLFVFESALGVV